MQVIKKIGLVVFLIGLTIFTMLPFMGEFAVSETVFNKVVQDKGINSEVFIGEMEENVVGKEFYGMLALSPKIAKALETANVQHRANKEYKKVIYTGPHDLAALIGKESGNGLYCSQ